MLGREKRVVAIEQYVASSTRLRRNSGWLEKRRPLQLSLDGLPEATGKAKSILRELISPVTIKTEGDLVWGEFDMRPDVLLRVADRDSRGDELNL